MKKIVVFLFLFLAVQFRAYADAQPTPVIFIHGLDGGPGLTYYNMYANFAAQGFPEVRMNAMLVPRIGVAFFGDPTDYAWPYTDTSSPYDPNLWNHTGNVIYNLPALINAIQDMLKNTGASQVDLVGHSNGTALIRLLLTNPTYAAVASKVRKVVFISGYANVSGSYNLNTINYFLKSVAGDEKLPKNIKYYALSSDSDSNINSPNPKEYDTQYGPVWAFSTAVLPSANVTNKLFVGLDHANVHNDQNAIATVYQWLSGSTFKSLSWPRYVNIGGMIVNRGLAPYKQVPQSCGLVVVKYYDPQTGRESGFAGFSFINSQGKYSVSSVDSTKYIKIIVYANDATGVWFLGDNIRFNNNALDLVAPQPIIRFNWDGDVSIEVRTYYEFLSRIGYLNKSANSFSGKIITPGFNDIILGNAVLPGGLPSVWQSSVLLNYGITTVDMSLNTYTFGYNINGAYNSKDIQLVSNLNNKGNITIMVNGADRSQNISDNLLYLYK